MFRSCTCSCLPTVKSLLQLEHQVPSTILRTSILAIVILFLWRKSCNQTCIHSLLLTVGAAPVSALTFRSWQEEYPLCIRSRRKWGSLVSFGLATAAMIELDLTVQYTYCISPPWLLPLIHARSQDKGMSSGPECAILVPYVARWATYLTSLWTGFSTTVWSPASGLIVWWWKAIALTSAKLHTAQFHRASGSVKVSCCSNGSPQKLNTSLCCTPQSPLPQPCQMIGESVVKQIILIMWSHKSNQLFACGRKHWGWTNKHHRRNHWQLQTRRPAREVTIHLKITMAAMDSP